MRQVLLLAVLLSGAGCQALGDRDCRHDGHDGLKDSCRKSRLAGLLHHHCPACETPKTCESPKTPAAPPPQKAPPPVQEVEAPRVPSVAQDILLIPKTVYIPYAPQTPTAPVRLSNLPPGLPGPEQPKAPGPAAPGPSAPGPAAPSPQPPPCDATQQLLKICETLNQRLDCLERKQREQMTAPQPVAPCPTVVPCPPTRPFLPLFRRPLFPQCDSMQQCDPCATPGGASKVQTITPLPEVHVPAAPEKIMSMPRPIEVTPVNP